MRAGTLPLDTPTDLTSEISLLVQRRNGFAKVFVPSPLNFTAHMTPFARRAIILAVLMLSTSMLTVAVTPRGAVAKAAQFQLETIIPRQFGDWQVDEQITHQVINPQAQETLSSLYSQTLSRTYFNSDGRRIMLSLAYGEDQSSHNRIHRPELCYPSQGFQIIDKWKDAISVDSVTLPVMRITAQLGNRHEPVTYWIRVGDTLVRGVIEQTFSRVAHGLTGNIPDGILFRVSEINQNTQDSYVVQDQFIQALLLSLSPANQELLIGSLKQKETTN
jgi:EpsI family protein